MGLLSKYTKAELKKLDKKTFMKEASYDDIFTDLNNLCSNEPPVR